MDPNEIPRNRSESEDALHKLEERVARLESYLGLEESIVPASSREQIARASEGEDEELEFEVGQKWFAKAGIVVLAVGMAFVLTFPYSGLPNYFPSLFGFVVAGGMIALARLWRSSYTLISQYLFGAGLALLYFATLRLFFFSPDPPLEPDSPIGILLLVLVVTLILLISYKRQSVYLTGLALAYASGAWLAVGSAWVVLPGLMFLAVCSMEIRLRAGWNAILILGTVVIYLTHLVWAVGNPLRGNAIQMISSPAINIWFVLVYAVFLSASVLRRKDRETEGLGLAVAAGLNVAGSYGLFLLLTLTAFGEGFVFSHVVASLLFLALAVLFWTRERSQYSTFLYSMVGYMALSVALLKGFTPPGVFVWLSLQSILVLSTAIWFRSRFIVVANFVIYLAIIIGYLVVTEVESGMSVGFGVVALVSARILNWQKDRLELRTEMMRNAYLASAFCAFPYALWYLMPEGTASLSWVGIALFYYLMSVLVKKQKYRWMGHLTLGLTVLYVMVIGIIQLEETYRILSFLVLGCVLIVVSIVFTRLRLRRKDRENP